MKKKYFSHLICESGAQHFNEFFMEPKKFKSLGLHIPKITVGKEGKQVIAYGETLEEATEKAVDAIELDDED